MHIVSEGQTLTVYLSGELDHHAAGAMRERTDRVLTLKAPGTLILDFSGVTFMDSSGVGFVMGRCKKAAAIGCGTRVRGLRPRDRRIMEMSGLRSIAEFE